MNKHFGTYPFSVGQLLRRILLLALLVSLPYLHSDAQETKAEGLDIVVSQSHSLSLHTNTFAWILALPNIGAEYAFAPRWSVVANYYHNWFSSNRLKLFWRIYGGEVELRYWLWHDKGAIIRHGHHLGLYTQMFTYDIKFNDIGTLAKTPQWGLGLSYGYTYPIGNRFALEFSFGLGLVSGRQERYRYCATGGCYAWQETLHRTYIGPTKLAITLSYLL